MSHSSSPIPACDSQRTLTAGAILAEAKQREMRWRPGLGAASHSEVFASGNDASGAGLALALACDGLAVEDAARRADPLADAEDHRAILWVQDAQAIRRGGRPYLHGLPKALRHRVIHVAAKTARDALFALEEGVRCRDLAFVVGELAGNPRELDFTASRRLSLTAEKHGVPLWLVRLNAGADLSSARMRWRAQAAPSARPRWNRDAPGAPAWQAELFRARMHPPGQWILSDEKGYLRNRRPTTRSPATNHTATNHKATKPPAAPPGHGDMVRPTVGRSLAAL